MGLTHLGLVSASGLAGKGFLILCYDDDAERIAKLVQGELPISEPDLPQLIAANGTRQCYSSTLSDLASCDVVYIAPDVPTDAQGRSNVEGIKALITRVIPALGAAAILVILSQVPPGFSRSIDFPPARLFYQVETLIFGLAVERATQPERYLIGCADPQAALPQAYGSLLEAYDCPILRMRYESAELAKISINMCLMASISVANTMAEICEHTGADWAEIVPALKLDRRIGAYSYLHPGLGIAGGNLERDLATVCALAQTHGSDAGVVRAWLANSLHGRDWAVRRLRHIFQDEAPPLLAVWGLTYKENTASIKNSPSLATLAALPEMRICAHDPAVHVELARHPQAKGARDPLAALEGANALAILTPWPEYRNIAPQDIAVRLARHKKWGRVVIDPYRVLDTEEAKAAGLHVHCLGVAAPKADPQEIF